MHGHPLISLCNSANAYCRSCALVVMSGVMVMKNHAANGRDRQMLVNYTFKALLALKPLNPQRAENLITVIIIF